MTSFGSISALIEARNHGINNFQEVMPSAAFDDEDIINDNVVDTMLVVSSDIKNNHSNVEDEQDGLVRLIDTTLCLSSTSDVTKCQENNFIMPKTLNITVSQPQKVSPLESLDTSFLSSVFTIMEDSNKTTKPTTTLPLRSMNHQESSGLLPEHSIWNVNNSNVDWQLLRRNEFQLQILQQESKLISAESLTRKNHQQQLRYLRRLRRQNVNNIQVQHALIRKRCHQYQKHSLSLKAKAIPNDDRTTTTSSSSSSAVVQVTRKRLQSNKYQLRRRRNNIRKQYCCSNRMKPTKFILQLEPLLEEDSQVPQQQLMNNNTNPIIINTSKLGQELLQNLQHHNNNKKQEQRAVLDIQIGMNCLDMND